MYEVMYWSNWWFSCWSVFFVCSDEALLGTDLSLSAVDALSEVAVVVVVGTIVATIEDAVTVVLVTEVLAFVPVLVATLDVADTIAAVVDIEVDIVAVVDSATVHRLTVVAEDETDAIAILEGIVLAVVVVPDDEHAGNKVTSDAVVVVGVTSDGDSLLRITWWSHFDSLLDSTDGNRKTELQSLSKASSPGFFSAIKIKFKLSISDVNSPKN